MERINDKTKTQIRKMAHECSKLADATTGLNIDNWSMEGIRLQSEAFVLRFVLAFNTVGGVESCIRETRKAARQLMVGYEDHETERARRHARANGMLNAINMLEAVLKSNR